jgi:hypothetical protein
MVRLPAAPEIKAIFSLGSGSNSVRVLAEYHKAFEIA